MFLIGSSKTHYILASLYTSCFILCVYKRYKWNKMTTNITFLLNDNLGIQTVFTLSMIWSMPVFSFSFRFVRKGVFFLVYATNFVIIQYCCISLKNVKCENQADHHSKYVISSCLHLYRCLHISQHIWLVKSYQDTIQCKEWRNGGMEEWRNCLCVLLATGMWLMHVHFHLLLSTLRLSCATSH